MASFHRTDREPSETVPRLLGGLVDGLFELGVDLLTLRQQPVHVAAPCDSPQRGLGDLRDRKGLTKMNS